MIDGARTGLRHVAAAGWVGVVHIQPWRYVAACGGSRWLPKASSHHGALVAASPCRRITQRGSTIVNVAWAAARMRRCSSCRYSSHRTTAERFVIANTDASASTVSALSGAR